MWGTFLSCPISMEFEHDEIVLHEFFDSLVSEGEHLDECRSTRQSSFQSRVCSVEFWLRLIQKSVFEFRICRIRCCGTFESLFNLRFVCNGPSQ